MPITAILSAHTCGDACWHAKDDICHCSCGGVNHGIMRNTDGKQPTRTARIDGLMYELKAVGDVENDAQAINKAAGIQYHFAHTSRQHFGYTPAALMRAASKAQIEKWPELAGYRNRPDLKPWENNSVYLLWVAYE